MTAGSRCLPAASAGRWRDLGLAARAQPPQQADRHPQQQQHNCERDQRRGEDTGDAPEDAKHQEVGIAWGQTLYNITSGRRTTPEAPRSRDEADYLEKISQLQKSWEREQQVLREELTSKARAIEEVILEPEPRGIDTRRYIVLWIPDA